MRLFNLSLLLVVGGMFAALYSEETEAQKNFAMTAADVEMARNAPITDTEHDIKQFATSTTTSAFMTTEPAVWDSWLVQNLVVDNVDGAITVCVDIAARTVVQTCADACGAYTMVCGAAGAQATSGKWITFGESYETAITSKDCLCGESASGTPLIVVEQTNRYPGGGA